MTHIAVNDDAEVRRFLAGFIGLTLLSGITIGMNKVLGTLLGVHLGVDHWQLGVIFGAESLAMALFTLPSGYLLARGNPRHLYAAVSLVLAALYLLLPHLPLWWWVAVVMFGVGLCISLRVVAAATVFMARLPQLGQRRAGWYKGTLMLGVLFAGPLLGNQLIASFGLVWGYTVSALLFATLATLGLRVFPSAVARPDAASAAPASLRTMLGIPEVRRIYVFEVIGNITTAAFTAFAILAAVEILDWPLHHGVWLIVAQGLAVVTVLLGGGRLVLQSGRERQWFATGHVLIVLALLLLGTTRQAPLFVLAAIALGLGLGLNNLVNFSRLSQLPVNKASASAQLTLSGMLGSTFGAVAAGTLSHRFGLPAVYLSLIGLWLLARLPLSLPAAAVAPAPFHPPPPPT